MTEDLVARRCFGPLGPVLIAHLSRGCTLSSVASDLAVSQEEAHRLLSRLDHALLVRDEGGRLHLNHEAWRALQNDPTLSIA